ncbi:MAG: L,D-transpeptidase [Bacteroidota bacterium]|nr:L,D-transpeptidase [Bacteroidota bacterium]
MKRFASLSMLLCAVAALTSFRSKEAGPADFYIVIEKHTYEMQVYDADNTWLISYPVVFGNKDLGDKMVQGDRKTPEGTFHISSKRIHPKWSRFLALDYPNAESYAKFNERKAEGLIPSNAKIGGEIGIHGTWPNEDFAVDQYQNWTEGCISTKNEYIRDIFSKIPVGTKVVIRR